MRRRPVRLATYLSACAAVALMAGCTSTTHGVGALLAGSTTAGTVAPPPPTSSAQPSSNGSTTTAAVATGAELAGLLRAGIATEHSAHIVLAQTSAAGSLGGVADEQLRNGVVTALHITQQVGAGITYQIIVVGHRAFAKLPAFFSLPGSGTRPWNLVFPGSRLGPIQGIARTLPGVRYTASPATLVQYCLASDAVHSLGPRLVGGVSTAGYEIEVVTAKLPRSSLIRPQLESQHLRKVSVEIDADATGRPVRFQVSLDTASQIQTSTIEWSRFDRPVSITPPPPGQVGRS